jgi:tRNA (Thr-GGU) A37 N-methylase
VITLNPIGRVSSSLIDRKHAPKQGNEGAPAAWLVFEAAYEEALHDVSVGEEYLLITWLHQGDRATLRVHPVLSDER